MDPIELSHRWTTRDPIGGVAFARDEGVRVVAGTYTGAAGTVVGLLEVEPEARYLVRLAEGIDVRLRQGELVGVGATGGPAALGELQRWYSGHCDGEWEHHYGVRIETLDNPGWSLKVDLTDTPLSAKAFEPVDRTGDGREWLVAQIEEGRFAAYGGPNMLGTMVQLFLSWARSPG